MVNIKPLVKGHVLVIPQRRVARFSDLTQEEITDLFTRLAGVAYESVQKVGCVVEKAFEADSLTITVQVFVLLLLMQDGVHAGQSIPHMHAHILPRRANDLQNNDDVYDMIFDAGRAMNGEYKSLPKGGMDAPFRQTRTLNEMEQEARWLEQYFYFS